MTDEDRHHIMLAYLSRKGAEAPATRLIKKSKEQGAEVLPAGAALENDELPVAVTRRSETRWCVITSRKVMYYDDGRLIQMPFDCMIGIEPIINDYSIPSKMFAMRIFLVDGSRHVVEVEPGQPFNAIFGMLANRLKGDSNKRCEEGSREAHRQPVLFTRAQGRGK